MLSLPIYRNAAFLSITNILLLTSVHKQYSPFLSVIFYVILLTLNESNLYAVIDIETTGGSPVNDKITEIAIYIHDGYEVIEEYSTLINPERLIPPFITNLTGITNEMVKDAPKFYEVARKIIEMTDRKKFVAHNASFDYNFIKNEFKNLGYDYNRDKICTVQWSRKLLPGYKSYSLGKLCDHFNIKINNRHRAAGDAFATTKLLKILLDKAAGPNLFQ